jgi:hypothetical protein
VREKRNVFSVVGLFVATMKNIYLAKKITD